MNFASAFSSNATLARGPVTRPFPVEPSSSPGSLPSRPDNDLWRQKQQEILELQEASQNLLRLSSNSQNSTPSGITLGRSLLPNYGGVGTRLFGSETVSSEVIDEGSLLGSASDLLGSGSGNMFGSSSSNSKDDVTLGSSSIAPLSLLSSQNAELSLSMPLLPAVSAELDDASSLRSASTIARLGVRQSFSSSPSLPLAPYPSEPSRPSVLSVNGSGKSVPASLDLQAENAALRTEVLELRRAATEKDQELRSLSLAARSVVELKARLAEADRRIAELTDEVHLLRKTEAMVELLKGDGAAHKVVRSYIENDMATMRAERRMSEQRFRADLQEWQDRTQQLQLELQIANDKLRQIAPNGDFQTQLDALKARAEKGSEEERRKAKREFAKRSSELQEREDECRAAVEQAAAKAKDVERTMHHRLSEARQERQRVEGRLKKQVQTLQTEVQEVRLSGIEAQEQRGNNSELQEALGNLRSTQEECSALSKRCALETRRNEALQQTVKREGEHMEMELLKEHSRTHDEAWERLSAVEDRHATQIKELQRAHGRELQLVAEQVTGQRVGIDAHALESELKAEHSLCAQQAQEIISLENFVREARGELAKVREDADNATKNYDSLVAVLRREREVADTQFQQLIRNTEEKQKAIGRLQHEIAWEDGMEVSSPTHAHSMSTAGWSSSMALATAAQQVQGSEPGEDSPRSAVDPRILDGSGHREGNVDVMLKTLSIERDSQEARRCVEELRRMLSVAGPVNNSSASGVLVTLSSSETLPPMEWRSQAHRLLEHLHSIHERVSKQAADENKRIQEGYDREAALKERFVRMEAKQQRKHEQAVQHTKSHALERLRSYEAEVVQMESALQAAFDGEREELRGEMSAAKDAFSNEAAEFNVIRKKCEVVIASEAVAIKCSVDAAEAKVAADMRIEMSELRRDAQAEIADGIQSRQNDVLRFEEDIAMLEKDQAAYRENLELEESEERAEVRTELEQLSRVLHRELSATRDEHTAFVRREARLEARVDGVRLDCSEAETEFKQTSAKLERNVECKTQQLEDLEFALQAAMRRSATTQNEWTVDRIETEAELEQLLHRHAEDREMLAREVTQFQDEKIILEDKMRQQEASGLAQIQAMQQKLDDVEIALQRAEAVSEERLHLLEFAREKRLQRQRNSVQSLSTNGEMSSPLRTAPTNRRPTNPSQLMQASMIQDLESEVRSMSEEHEERFEVQAEDFMKVEKALKEQLGKLREDKLRERQMKDRQIDKLKSRVSEFEKNGEIGERRQASEAAQHRRQLDEYAQQIDKMKGEKRQLTGTLQETLAERARITSGSSELQEELILSEDLLGKAHNQCQELVAERYNQEESFCTWRTEIESIVAARDNAMRAVQDLEIQREQSRRQVEDFANEAQEACISTERLTQALDSELQQLLPVLPDNEARQLEDVRGPGGVPSEAAVVGTFQALARFVADLARQNAELRCGPDRPRRMTHDDGVSQSNVQEKRQIAALQKEIVKLREETQEVRLENRHLISQLKDTRHRLASQAEEEINERGPGSPGAASRLSGSIAPSVLSESRSLDALQRPRQPPQPTSTSSHTDHRLRMKQLHAEKVKAETDLITYKQELSRKTQEMLAENDRLQSLLWETQQEKQKAEEASRKKNGQLERKVRMLEGRLQERMELEKQLTEEKFCVEEQLNLAAKQLEGLLVEEHKDCDLQRDLAGLSRQFEQLHVKHRAQLAKTVEQGQALERERETRSQVEEALHEANAEIEREACKHAEQMNSMQEQVTSLWKKIEAKERELQESVAEQTSMTCEASTLRSKQQQQTLSTKELQDEIRRLQEELAQQHELLRDAREKGPGATGALQKLRMKEHELDDAQQATQVAEAARQRAQAEARARAIENEDLRRANENLREEIRRNRESSQPEAWQRYASAQQDARSNPTLSSESAFADRGETADQKSWDQAYPDSSRISRRAQDLIDEANEVVVRTVADTRAERSEPSRTQSSLGRGGDGVQSPPGQTSLLTALDEIQDTLNSRERELQQHKLGQQEPPRSIGTGMQSMAGFGKSASELDLSPTSPHTIAEVERNFAEAALAHGFHGDQVSRLWAEANARAEALDCHTLNGFPPTPPQQPRATPIATDVELKGSLEKGAAVRGGGYPESPPVSVIRGAESFAPASSNEDSLASLDVPASSSTSRWPKSTSVDTVGKHGLLASEAKEESPATATLEEQAAKTPPNANDNAQDNSHIGLPSSARELFRRAEALCERHKFSEAVPCFHQVLSILESEGPDAESVPPVVVAEVWAHLGVAMQSLDRVREAIDSYRKAVALDESLHVCFANLATLHAYLSEHDAATEYISKALRLDPTNPTYVQIRRHLDESPGQQSESAQSTADEPERAGVH